MKLNDVIEIISGLSDAGVTVWVDGGWCVDELVGRRLREHNDLDITICRSDVSAMNDWLAARGYTDHPSPDRSAWNYADEQPVRAAPGARLQTDFAIGTAEQSRRAVL